VKGPNKQIIRRIINVWWRSLTFMENPLFF